MGQICTRDEEVEKHHQDNQQDDHKPFALKPLGGPNSVHHSGYDEPGHFQPTAQPEMFGQSNPQFSDNNKIMAPQQAFGNSNIMGSQVDGFQIGGGSQVNRSLNGSAYQTPAPVVNDDHPSSKNFETVKMMHALNPTVQKKLDNLVAFDPRKAGEVYQQYANLPQSQNILKHTTLGWTYQGQMNKGVPQGLGRQINSDGTLTEGFFHEGVATSYVRRILPNGTVYEGGIKDGMFDGKGIMTDPNGYTTESARWTGGVADGETITMAPNKRVIFKGNLTKGRKNGLCTYYDERQQCTEIGNFVDDVLDGQGERIWDNGRRYVGIFKKGVEEGKGTMTFVDGRRFEGPFSSGKPNGDGILWTDTNQQRNQTWKNGRRV